MRIFWYAQKSRFLTKIIKLYSELSYTYPLLFGSKTFMIGQLGDFPGPNMPPNPILATFSKVSGRPKDIGEVCSSVNNKQSDLLKFFPLFLTYRLPGFQNFIQFSKR